MEENLSNSLSWERFAQFHLIEVVALWEGRLTTNHLQTAFSIGRSKASIIIGIYQQEVSGNLSLCSQVRGYIPSKTFEPRYSRGEVNEYLALLHSGSILNTQVYGLKTGQAAIEVVQTLTRPVSPDVVRTILHAMRDKKRIEVYYRSLTTPDGEERCIAPHTLVSAEGRWHVRAFCERDRTFKDFVLHRFVSVPEIYGDRLEKASPSYDTEWDRIVEMVVTPNSALLLTQQQLVADDYAMGADKLLHIPVRAPLVKYMMIALRIGTPEQTQENPNAHQLSLANRDELVGLIL